MVKNTRMSSPIVSGSCTINSGCYGGTKANNGDMLYVNLQCGKGPTSMQRKQIILLIDESGSMTLALPSVRKSLRIAVSTLLSLMGQDPNDEEILSTMVDMTIIGFSKTSRIIWHSAKSGAEPVPGVATFSQAISDISASGPTNLEHGLREAFSLVKGDSATWIILFTDGVPSEGELMTPTELENMAQNMPYKSNTKIIPLGFTKDFDADLLSRLGSFTYVQNEQMIAGVFASIMTEIYMCFGVNGVFSLQSSPEGTEHDKFIKEHKSTVVFGKYNVGFIQAEKSFSLGILPFGNTRHNAIKEFANRSVYFEYFDINTGQHRLVRIPIQDEIYRIPDEIRTAYFQASTARIMQIIYRRRNSSTFPTIVDEIKRKLADWEHVTARPYKAKIRLALEDDNYTDSMHHAMAEASNTEHQTSYVDNEYATASQQNAMRSAVQEFMASQHSQSGF